ncbi:UDP-glucoronosyl and UDP-glucosyl transferase, partial [Trichostrongylus colubriformis]
MDPEESHKTGLKLTKKIIKPPIVARVHEMMKYKLDMMSKMWTMQPSVSSLIQVAQNMTALFVYQCEGNKSIQELVNDDALLRRLANEKFDVGISEAVGICGLGLFEALKIPSSIATFSSTYADVLSKSIGEPAAPSYVPGGMATYGDRMNFLERARNAVEGVMGQKIFGIIFSKEIEIFRAKFGSQFRDYGDIIADASYVFTNSNPYLDFPRPMLHKTVSIGGVAVQVDPKKNVLPKEWHSILNERNTTVLVSFGSATKSIYMPDEY